MKSSRRIQALVVASFALALAPFVFANDDDEIRTQQDKQRAVQAETDHVVKRITTMMRVMQFYNLESPEKKVMEEMGATLANLSKTQMVDVIKQLEAAQNAKDEKSSEEAYDKAHEAPSPGAPVLAKWSLASTPSSRSSKPPTGSTSSPRASSKCTS